MNDNTTERYANAPDTLYNAARTGNLEEVIHIASGLGLVQVSQTFRVPAFLLVQVFTSASACQAAHRTLAPCSRLWTVCGSPGKLGCAFAFHICCVSFRMPALSCCCENSKQQNTCVKGETQRHSVRPAIINPSGWVPTYSAPQHLRAGVCLLPLAISSCLHFIELMSLHYSGQLQALQPKICMQAAYVSTSHH